jgi:hypothetical protein
MARTLFEGHVTAGNGAYTTVYEMPAGASGVVTSLSAYNSAGTVALTLKIVKRNSDAVILNTTSIGAAGSQSYAGNSTMCLCPMVLMAGELLQASANSTTMTVNASGIYFS